jgi:PHP family Zn ribbon phosphoesterase|tara:strand:+ start:384 stop:596 length:213 start_codon:yes stop_codon:yes gene_type:complete
MAKYFMAECTECNVVFRMQDLEENSPNELCKCGNIEVGVKKAENSRYPFYFAVTYSRVKPRIYELNDQTS